jgi:hypothetical protein
MKAPCSFAVLAYAHQDYCAASSSIAGMSFPYIPASLPSKMLRLPPIIPQ